MKRRGDTENEDPAKDPADPDALLEPTINLEFPTTEAIKSYYYLYG